LDTGKGEIEMTTATDITPHALRTGMLAFLDTTFSGLVPCKVTELERDKNSGEWFAHIVLTATRGAYKRGENLRERAADVAPRQCKRQRQGKILLRNSWHIVDADGVRHDVFTAK
jgi:hypothetical protein